VAVRDDEGCLKNVEYLLYHCHEGKHICMPALHMTCYGVRIKLSHELEGAACRASFRVPYLLGVSRNYTSKTTHLAALESLLRNSPEQWRRRAYEDAISTPALEFPGCRPVLWAC
jgi:metallophosphoesterase superfamily enzyme